jgi:hypothetical protein
MELMATLARALFLFDFGLAGDLGEGKRGRGWGRERRGEYQLEDVFVSWKDGPLLEFWRRRAGLNARRVLLLEFVIITSPPCIQC